MTGDLMKLFERAGPTGRTLLKGAAAALVVVILAGLVSLFRGETKIAALDDEIECLALNVYFEARSEDQRGQSAIAHLTLNRVDSPAFPDTVCGVVTQGQGGRHRCQFSWYCDGLHDSPANPAAWENAMRIARAARSARGNDPTRGAVYFHLRRVEPLWAEKLTRTVEIGDHLFYK
ncbi:MAG: cell wall hydrolase [Alphaproteobacteria bacterium]|nr:cell wall hydrolase [Alphaproteobacteria bacterium]